MNYSVSISRFLLLMSLCATSIAAQDFASFQNSGVLESASWKLPDSWSPESKFAWQATLKGYGQSSPVVFNNTVYVTSVVGANKESIRVEAFNAKDGKSKWFFEHPNSTPEKNTVMVSRAAPTPVVDQNGVIAFFEGGDIVALDHEGKKRWSRSFRNEFGDIKARHGIASSLEQDERHVFVWVERMEAPYIAALSKEDGSDVWNKPGLGATTWSSPRLIDVGEKKQLVLSAIGNIAGYDPGTGEQLWLLTDISSNSSATPVPIENSRFLIGAGSSRPGQNNVPSCGVIKIDKVDDVYVATWDWRTEKASCSFGSPIAHDGKAYFVNRSGIVYCHDIKSGQEIYKGRLPCNQIWATPLATKEGVYFFGKDGITSILAAGPKLKVVNNNRLWNIESQSEESDDPAQRFGGAVLYSAAIADSKLILRRGDRLFAIGQ